MAKIALFPVHPAQIWLLRALERKLHQNGQETIWIIRSKDISVDLANNLGIDYVLISNAKSGVVGNAIELFINIFKCAYLTLKHGIDVWITKYSAASMAARFLGRKAVTFFDDDINQTWLLSYTCFPFVKKIYATDDIDLGPFKQKALRTGPCLELMYLHKDEFQPDPTIKAELGVNEGERYALIRTCALNAHHDVGIKGIGPELLDKAIRLFENNDIKVFITSEKKLGPKYEKYRLSLPPHKIHSAMYFATLLFGDSLTMCTEASLLGTPSVRVNDFSHRISTLKRLVDEGISYSYPSSESDAAFKKLESLVQEGPEESFHSAWNTFFTKYSNPGQTMANDICKVIQS